jgi:hypothetical protein
LPCGPNLKLKDLENEGCFPYALNTVRVEAGANGAPLLARLECFEKSV